MHRSTTFSLLLPLVFALAACSGSNEPQDEEPFDVPWNFGDSDGGEGDADSDVGPDDADGDTDDRDGSESDTEEPDVVDPDVSDTNAEDADVDTSDTSDDADAGDASVDSSHDADAGDANVDTSDGSAGADASDTGVDTTDVDAAADATDAASDADTVDAPIDVDTGPPDVGPRCGDGTLDVGEECDDGNTDDGDGCDSECVVEPFCGDGNLDALLGEECDDGNNSAGDGCDPTCVVECADGYASVDGVCEDIDECALDFCDAVVTCSNTDGGFECGECPLGYVDVRGDGTLCDSLFALPPDDAPQCYLWGTHHMRSFDGLAYDLQGAGEWRMVVDPDDAGFEIQVRQEPLPDNDRASRITRVAVQVGEHRVEVADDGGVFVDGVSATVPLGGVDFEIASLHPVAETWVIAWQSRAQVRVTRTPSGLDVEVYPAPEQEGRLRGLCADAAGTPVDDILPPEGEAMLPPVAVEALYAEFVHLWAVADEASLFTYAAGEGPESVFDATQPIEYLEAAELGDADRALYEPACVEADLGHPFLVEACILDAYWGDSEVAIAAARRVRDPELILALDKPLLFARWEQQGPRPNGVWSVSADFSRVSQSVNGDPTLFVSPNSYINVLIEGTIQVATTDDDDLVGFVFGLRSPISAEGDPVTTFDTYLLDWKQRDQTASGSFAPAGFALSYVNDDFARSGWLRFWSRADVDGFESLATDFAPTRGWVDNAVNEFRLLHTTDRIDIWMNGELIFRESGTFQDGRFGFYNYSQPVVRYSNFRAVNVTARTLCGDGVLDVGEECDDENTENGDGCASDCTTE